MGILSNGICFPDESQQRTLKTSLIKCKIIYETKNFHQPKTLLGRWIEGTAEERADEWLKERNNLRCKPAFL